MLLPGMAVESVEVTETKRVEVVLSMVADSTIGGFEVDCSVDDEEETVVEDSPGTMVDVAVAV